MISQVVDRHDNLLGKISKNIQILWISYLLFTLKVYIVYAMHVKLEIDMSVVALIYEKGSERLTRVYLFNLPL